MAEACSVSVESSSPWIIAHEALSRLARQRAVADVEEGRWLLAALRAAAHVHLGFGCFSEYIERSFGYKPRSTQEKLRVAEALEALPLLTRALSEGLLHWSSVRELTRVAVADTEREWLELARGKTLRQMEELVAGRQLGDGPSAPRDPAARRHVLRFEVSAETFALFREARGELRRRSDAPLDDDAVLFEMSRLALGGPRDEGRASYQVSLCVCPECGSGQQAASGELVAVGAEIVAMARCDAQEIGLIGEQLGFAPVEHTAPANETTSAEPSAANESTPVGMEYPRAQRESAPVGAPKARREGGPPMTRATQRIPPALRRAVLARDQRRCRVPGCKNTIFLDVHHIQLRSERGRNTAQNLVTLCGAHHRALHLGQLSIDGSSTAAVFRHADGSEYGHVDRPHALDASAKVFAGLRHLGFREGEVRRVLGELHSENRLRDASAEELLREALKRLCPPRASVR